MKRVFAYFKVPEFFGKSLGIARFLYPLSVILLGPGSAPGFTYFLSRVLLASLLLFIGGRIASNILSSSIRPSSLSPSPPSPSFPSLLSSSFSGATPVSLRADSRPIPTPIPITPASAFPVASAFEFVSGSLDSPDSDTGSDNSDSASGSSVWIVCRLFYCAAFCAQSSCLVPPDDCVPTICASDDVTDCVATLEVNGYDCTLQVVH